MIPLSKKVVIDLSRTFKSVRDCLSRCVCIYVYVNLSAMDYDHPHHTILQKKEQSTYLIHSNVYVYVCVHVCTYIYHPDCNNGIFIPKLYLRLLWFFRRTAALFRQIRTFPQLFRFCSDLGNSAIRQIVRNSMLTGR